MLVNVTDEHIADGYKNNCILCPVALACKGAGAIYASVTETVAELQMSEFGPRFFVDLPEEACLFIHKFDHGYRVEPFTFELKEVA